MSSNLSSLDVFLMARLNLGFGENHGKGEVPSPSEHIGVQDAFITWLRWNLPGFFSNTLVFPLLDFIFWKQTTKSSPLLVGDEKDEEEEPVLLKWENLHIPSEQEIFLLVFQLGLHFTDMEMEVQEGDT
jgi:hypothetical protein